MDLAVADRHRRMDQPGVGEAPNREGVELVSDGAVPEGAPWDEPVPHSVEDPDEGAYRNFGGGFNR